MGALRFMTRKNLEMNGPRAERGADSVFDFENKLMQQFLKLFKKQAQK